MAHRLAYSLVLAGGRPRSLADLKTTVFGLTGHSPAFVMLMIGANAGVIGMTKEHLGLALALQKPVFVVVTKIDMCSFLPPFCFGGGSLFFRYVLPTTRCLRSSRRAATGRVYSPTLRYLLGLTGWTIVGVKCPPPSSSSPSGPPNVLASTLKLLQKILKSAGVRKLPMMINSTDDVVDASKNFLSQRLCTAAATGLFLLPASAAHSACPRGGPHAGC